MPDNATSRYSEPEGHRQSLDSFIQQYAWWLFISGILLLLSLPVLDAIFYS